VKGGTGFKILFTCISGCRGLNILEEFYLLGYDAM
jgi:hypothetical protein